MLPDQSETRGQKREASLKAQLCATKLGPNLGAGCAASRHCRHETAESQVAGTAVVQQTPPSSPSRLCCSGLRSRFPITSHVGGPCFCCFTRPAISPRGSKPIPLVARRCRAADWYGSSIRKLCQRKTTVRGSCPIEPLPQTGSSRIWVYFRKVRRQPFSYRLGKGCPLSGRPTFRSLPHPNLLPAKGWRPARKEPTALAREP